MFCTRQLISGALASQLDRVAGPLVPPLLFGGGEWERGLEGLGPGLNTLLGPEGTGGNACCVPQYRASEEFPMWGLELVAVCCLRFA